MRLKQLPTSLVEAIDEAVAAAIHRVTLRGGLATVRVQFDIAEDANEGMVRADYAIRGESVDYGEMICDTPDNQTEIKEGASDRPPVSFPVSRYLYEQKERER